jgi:hypothetical protein
MTRLHSSVRAIVYTLFSVGAGVLAGNLIFLVLAQSSNPRLPLEGAASYLVLALFWLATLVFGQWEHFGRPVNLLKWIPLCLVTLGAAVFSMAVLLD